MSAVAADSNDRLLLALLIACALHMLVIFGVNFDAWRSAPPQQQVEVTLVQTPGRRPIEADHIAQADQQGSGNEAQRDLAAGQQTQLPQRALPTNAAAAKSEGRKRLAAPSLSSTDARETVVDRSGKQDVPEDLPETDRELARLSEQLARLQADLNAQSQPASRNSRTRRLDAVSAKAAIDAAYLADWRRRVEAVGNQYYPQASLRYGIYGSLEMLVTVRSSGELEDIRILKSSGYAVLDEAAIRIVRMAAPFSPFSDELRASTDKLEILRTWQFEQNPLSSR